MPLPGQRGFVVIAGCAWVGILLGCMSFTYQGHECASVHLTEDGISCFEGKAHVAPGQCLNVYYPTPFASKPNLEVSELFDRLVVVEQREDGFQVRNASPFNVSGEWQARGTRLAPQLPPAPAPIETTAAQESSAPPATEVAPQPAPVKP
jgi:hypothetical protein